MAAARNPLKIVSTSTGSKELIQRGASNEFFFAVVGHAGSGTSVIAQDLADTLGDATLGGYNFDVVSIKARAVIEEWAETRGKPVPAADPSGQRRISDTETLQNYGDQMRSEPLAGGRVDHAAVARGLVSKIREARAKKIGAPMDRGTPVQPDGKPRAYVLDALRHPAEARLLRSLYGSAFVLIGVVCEENKRIRRLTQKYSDCGTPAAIKFMKRDADAREPHGQHVADAFHLSDFFIDNTADRTKEGQPNPDWDVSESLSRLIKILTHSELLRPSVAETAMCHAYDAQMQSACLSRQVGAALVDRYGNVIATGTNEVPRAGGGVYGESFEGDSLDARCAFYGEEEMRFCRNTRTQNEIIEELLNEVRELSTLDAQRKEQLKVELRSTRIGSLLEFSRAVHAEMDALLSAARKGAPLMGTRLFVTTFPCHYCARHLVAAGVDEVQYIEPYPKSLALDLHRDAIAVERAGWSAPSRAEGGRVLFRPFSGIAPRMYRQAFLKDRDLKDKDTGNMAIGETEWVTPWHSSRLSYPELEAELVGEVENNA